MSLLTNLVAYWKLDEASGNALDALSANDLTAGGSPGSTTGKINGGRTFSGSQYFTHTDNADLSTGDIDFSFSAWVNLTNKSSGHSIVSQWASGDLGYLLLYHVGDNCFMWLVGDGAGNLRGLQRATTLGVPSTGTWYHIRCWHDAINNQIGIAVNGGAADVSATSGPTGDSTRDFEIGANNGGATEQMAGTIDEVGFWKRVLTSTDGTDLYNGGAGLPYSSFGGGATPAATTFAATAGDATLVSSYAFVPQPSAYAFAATAGDSTLASSLATVAPPPVKRKSIYVRQAMKRAAYY